MGFYTRKWREKHNHRAGGGWLKQGYDCEAAVYLREIEIPELAEGSGVILELGAVNHIARYYIGKDEASLRLIDEQVTAFTAQRVDLTPYVESGEIYLLKIEVCAWKNGRPVAPHWAEWSECVARGIFRSAQLLIYPQIYIEDIFVKPRVERGVLEIICRAKNSGAGAASISIGGTLSSDSGENWEYPEIPQKQLEIEGY